MKRYTDLLALFLILLASCLFGPQAKAQLFYEGFDNSTGSNILGIGNYGSSWHAVMGVANNPVTDITSATSGNYFMINGGAGNPNASAGFLSGGSTATGSTTYYAAYTTLASSLTIPTGTAITWTMGNNVTGMGVRLLVQSSGNWYTTGGAWNSNTTAFSTDSAFASAATASITYTYTFATTGWRSVTLTPGENLVLEPQPGASTLPTNQITAIGFFMYESNGNITRLDSLTVVPEPSSFALLGLGAGALGLLRLRRKS
ncbi:MAG: hypothetical protein B9S32_05175 [Verrucomicrobia bacterium Tous-C9LFEB]|nr:MAG: hypothetical protein B9S32_05175 [Verrucomicrobia bacterium Tous-C9LFEB]